MGGLSAPMSKTPWPKALLRLLQLSHRLVHLRNLNGLSRMNAMRRVIAERLQQSKQTAPHFYLTVECEIDTLLQARKALNEAAPEGVKISVNDMVVKAAAAALIAVPEVNGYFEAEGCRYFSDADICIAVAVDGGLVTLLFVLLTILACQLLPAPLLIWPNVPVITSLTRLNIVGDFYHLQSWYVRDQGVCRCHQSAASRYTGCGSR